MSAGWFALLWGGSIFVACLLHSAWHYGDVQALFRRVESTREHDRGLGL